MARSRDVETLQKFAAVHASIHNHSNHQRHLNRRAIFKQARAATLVEWRPRVCENSDPSVIDTLRRSYGRLHAGTASRLEGGVQ